MNRSKGIATLNVWNDLNGWNFLNFTEELIRLNLEPGTLNFELIEGNVLLIDGKEFEL